MKVLYKIVNSLAVLVMIPVLLFLPMFKFIMTVGVRSENQLLSLLGGMLDINQIIKMAMGIDLENLPETYTLKGVYDMFFGADATFSASQFDVSALPEAVVKYFSAAGILFALALVCAVVVLILGIFTKKKLLTGGFAIGGLALTFAANKCFTHIASQLVSGKISLVSMLENMESMAQYKTYLNYVNFDIRIFELSSAYSMLLMIFAAIVLFNIVFHIAESTMN